MNFNRWKLRHALKNANWHEQKNLNTGHTAYGQECYERHLAEAKKLMDEGTGLTSEAKYYYQKLTAQVVRNY